jgi:3-hydroxyacyl-CoA dehydrogenase
MDKVIGPDEVEVLVVGTGLMGASLAQAFAQNGVGVGLVGRRQESLDRALAFIRFELEEAVGKGIFSRPQSEDIGRHIRSSVNLEEVCRGRGLRLVIESVSENMALKRELFNWLDEFCGPDVLLASNTSCLDAEVLAAETGRPDRFAWMHFFFPAHKNRAAEYSGLSRTSETSLSIAAECLARVRKRAVRLLRYRKGGVANIIFVGLLLEAFRMLDEGYGSAGVEGAATAAFGLPAGFVRQLQSIGFDLAAACLDSFSDPSAPGHPLACAYDNFFSPPPGLKQKFNEARESGKLIPIEQLLSPIMTHRSDSAHIGDSLRRRFLAVAFMTAAEVVEAGLVAPADVDALCQTAFLWPLGPFALMNRVGVEASLEIVTEKMEISHRQEINFPVPRILIQQAQKKEPWSL